ncbi:site-specific DNA-methyltransferase [Patescibacteria group bacterium]|nr:site-specific DNA-methyltransferase [Patescibacteria group bacterium]
MKKTKIDKLNKISKQSPNLRQEILDKLKKIYPPLFNNQGKLNQEELEQLTKDFSTPQTEKYEFNWAGKQQSKKKAFTKSKATLKKDKKKSINFDKTQNLIIEGDNLEVLKLLQKSYFGKIKCIYIDPPYNTGNDFIYSDNFSENKKVYWEKNGVYRNGVKLDTNTESSGRYHSNWLSMIYPRLLLARNLLKEDGVIFVSIDDNEVHNLRKAMDEVFGEENFITTIMWKRKKEKSNDVKGFAVQGEYIIVYGKSESIVLAKENLSEEYIKSSYRKDNKGHYWRPVPITVDIGHKGGGYEYEILTPSGKKHKRLWRLPKKTYDNLLEKELIYFGKSKDGIPQRIKFLDEDSGTHPSNYWEKLATNKDGKKEILELFKFEVFDTVKPTKLIKKLFSLVSDSQDYALDFFAGSGTTAHAVMELNKEDGGNRKFILVQIPEATNEKSEAYKAGYKTISDICIERVKRAGTKILKQIQDDTKQQKLLEQNNKTDLDVGFKVFKLSKSHFPENTFTPDPEKSHKENLKALETYIKKATLQKTLFKNSIDLIYEIALKDGFELTLKIKKIKE